MKQHNDFAMISNNSFVKQQYVALVTSQEGSRSFLLRNNFENSRENVKENTCFRADREGQRSKQKFIKLPGMSMKTLLFHCNIN